MKQYYWDEFHGVNATAMGRYLTQKELEFIEAFLKDHRLQNCLEIGCGSGRLSIPIFKHGIKLTGIDIDALPLKLLHEREPKIKTIQADASKPLPFADKSFDCVFAIESMDYLTDIDSFFQECRRVLKPNGFIIFTIGNAMSYKSWLQKRFGRHQGRYLFSAKDVKSSLAHAGFKAINFKGYNWLPMRRESNSFLIPLASHFEQKLGLENLPSISPWIMCLACLQRPEGLRGGQAERQ